MSRGTVLTAMVTALIMIVLVAASGLIVSYAGIYNVAATQEHTSLARWFLETTMERSVAVRADELPDPPSMDSADVQHGFEHYRSMCVVCHGAPGIERGDFGQGMTPPPPELAEAGEEMSSKEIFWVTKNGIKLAGMPAFGPTHSDEEIWAIVAFVERLQDMSSDEYAQWEARHLASADSASGEGEEGHSHDPGTTTHSHQGGRM